MCGFERNQIVNTTLSIANGFAQSIIPQTDLSEWGSDGLLKDPVGVNTHRRPTVARCADQLLCAGCGLGDTCYRLVYAKWSLASLWLKKHNRFSTLCLQDARWAQIPPDASKRPPHVSQRPSRCLQEASRCLPEAIQMSPDASKRLPDVSQRPSRCLQDGRICIIQHIQGLFLANNIY